MGYSLYEMAWIFLLYAFIGWCCEVAFVALTTREFVNRGFLNGPVCPIYGFGMLIILLCLTPIRENPLLLFAGSVLLTSLLEFLAGFVLEKFFHEKWWDYTEEPFNIKGYICLRFSILWGLACLLVMNVFHPPIMKLIGWLDSLPGYILLGICGGVLLIDLCLTLITLLKLRARLRRMDQLEAKMRMLSDSLGAGISKGVFAAVGVIDAHQEEIDELKSKYADRKTALKEKMADSKARSRERLEQLKEKYDRTVREKNRMSKRLTKAYPGLRKGMNAREKRLKERLDALFSRQEEKPKK